MLRDIEKTSPLNYLLHVESRLLILHLWLHKYLKVVNFTVLPLAHPIFDTPCQIRENPSMAIFRSESNKAWQIAYLFEEICPTIKEEKYLILKRGY